MIRVENLTKSYNGEPCLRGTDFSVAAGEFVSLMGESGSGKTTLLEILVGLRKPDGGRVTVAGEDVLALSENALALFRRRLGVVYQSFGLIPTLTARENIALPLLLQGLRERDTAAAVGEMAERLSIAGCLSRRPGELSGGQCQRVAIARAVVHRPPLLLLDEPTGSLDHENTLRTLEFLAEYNRESGCTVLQITHDSAAAAYGTRVLRIRDGVILP